MDLPNFLADIGSKKCKYFSCIDLKAAYNQIPLSKRSQEICTFTCASGNFSPTTAIFGLKNLPHIFSQLTDLIFQDIKHKFMGYYQDDLLIFSESFTSHKEHIAEVLRRLRTAGLTADPKKTHLCQSSVQFLGFTLSRHGIYTAEHNIEKIKKFKACKSQRDCRAWLGLTGFYRRHIENYARISQPIVALTTGKFKWTKEAQESFEILRDKLIHAPLLAYPDMTSQHEFIVTVDSSSTGIGFTLSQHQYSEKIKKLIERPIMYGGTNLKHNQKKYGSTELELLGLTYAIGKLDNYLRGHKFKIYSDHKALGYLIHKKIDQLKPSLARKVIFLQQYDFELIHKAGKQIPHVDAISRHIYEEEETGNSDVEPEINIIKENEEKHILDFKDLNLDGFCIENIKKLQKKDYLFTSMYDFVKYDRLPSDLAMSKRIKTHHQDYIIWNRTLCHVKKQQGNEQNQQMCVPIELRSQIMQIYHDLKTSGHMGAFKMYSKASTRFYWIGMYSDMQNYVSGCRLCMQTNTGHPPKVALKPLPVSTEPFASIHIDLLRLYSPSRKNQYIIVLIDAFTHFVTLKSVKKKSAKVVAKFLFDEHFLKFGFPQLIATSTPKKCISDNGTDVVNAWTKALYDIMGVKLVTTSFYHPESNSQIERYNRTIIGILRKFVKDEPKKWSDYLPYVTHAINNSVCQSTGHTPFQLLYGVPIRDVVDVYLPRIPENTTKKREQAYTYFHDKVERIRKYAADNIKSAKENQKKNYDKHSRQHSFSKGDKVYIRIQKRKLNEDTKLRNQYEGPYFIKDFISPTNVTLFDKKGKPLPRSTLINNLKKCHIRKQFIQPKTNTPKNTESSSEISESSTDGESSINSTFITVDMCIFIVMAFL